MGSLVFGKGNFLPVGPQGTLIAVTTSLPDTHSWRGLLPGVCILVHRILPTTSAGLSILDILLGFPTLYLETRK